MNSKNYLISGSFAYDTVLLHNGAFHAKILPESISRLNVAFPMDSVKNEFGGTAGNIAYNASLLGQFPMLFGSLGIDGDPYAERMAKLGLDCSNLRRSSLPTPHAWILTDSMNNQITAFSQGSMFEPTIPPSGCSPDFWLLSPENPATSAAFAKKATELGKKYLFDPGQALPAFLDGAAESVFPLFEIVKNAYGTFANEYETELLCESIGADVGELVSDGSFFVKTLGGKGSEIFYGKGRSKRVSVAKAANVEDPTGCGDAFRAGFMHAITIGRDFERDFESSLIQAMKVGSTLGSFAIETAGGQNHSPSLLDVMDRAAKVRVE